MAEYGVPELQKPNLFRDWYEMFVAGKKAKPLSPSLDTSSPAPVTSMLPAATAPSGVAIPPPATPFPASPATPPSWSEKLNQGLQDPAKVGLLTAGLSMMATPPREVPYSDAEIIRRAGLAGISAFQGAVKSSRESKELEMRAREHKDLSGYRAAQAKHLEFQNQEIQEKIKAGQDMNQIYSESVTGGLDKTIETQYNLPSGTGKLVLKSSLKSGKGIHDMFKQSAVDPKDQEIPEDIVPLLGFPEGAKIKWSQAHAVSTLMPKPEKEKTLTPHTTLLTKDEKGKSTPGVQHVWAWNPDTKSYSDYVGPHGPTPGSGGGAGGGKMEGQAKVGILGAVNREMTNRWFPKLQAAMPPGDESMQKIKEIQIQIGMGDQVSGSVNDARMRAEFTKYGLDPKEYQWVKTRAQELAGGGKNPDAAINQAEAEYSAKNPKKGEPQIPANLKPIIDPTTGKQKTVGGRPAYQDPKKPGKVIVY